MIYKISSSYITMIVLMAILAISAAIGTFIENDFGSQVAKNLIYNSFWHHTLFLLASINLILIIKKSKMYKIKSRFLFHISFIVILIGAFITYIYGTDGVMNIQEGKSSNIILVNNKEIKIPFSIKLNDFILSRYPGSRAPSEFSSKVTVIDTKNNIKFDTVIFMNNTLVYQGYKFFQTSYPKDEKGTILSVNHDPGVEITYFGYALLFLTMILNLFDKKSRFQFLIKKVKNMPIASLLLVFSFIIQTPVVADDSKYIVDYLNNHKTQSKELANAFARLIVQSPDGRMKPLDTHNREILNKISGKDTWQGMDANQVVLGIFSRPSLWKKLKIIKVKTEKLRRKLGVTVDQKYVSFNSFFNTFGTYMLTKDVEIANQKVPSKRGTYDRDVIKVDERLNIFFMASRGVLLKLFPIPNDSKNSWVDFKTMFTKINNSKLKRAMSRLLENTYNRQYSKALQYIKPIKEFQYKYGKDIIPTKYQQKVELLFNDLKIFFKLSLVYIILGFILIIYTLFSMFYNNLINNKIKNSVIIISYILLLIHTIGIIARWYISGYIPISNTYETMIYISYSAIIASVMFLRKSMIALSASFIMAGIFMFAAYLGEIDPQITTLVPVLKSFWLLIHVAVITASYGFFGVGAILGIFTLILFKFNNNKNTSKHIKNITYINEITLLLGLVLLVIGNFLGGIWANESWGRYWGWDPKETWAYISILVYAIVVHIRLIKKIYSVYLFNVLSVLSFFSILMTYFGVNFYLAGMHSYATGDPVPIPQWVYITCGIVFAIIAISYPNRKLKEKNEKI